MCERWFNLFHLNYLIAVRDRYYSMLDAHAMRYAKNDFQTKNHLILYQVAKHTNDNFI